MSMVTLVIRNPCPSKPHKQLGWPLSKAALPSFPYWTKSLPEDFLGEGEVLIQVNQRCSRSGPGVVASFLDIAWQPTQGAKLQFTCPATI